MPAPLRPLALHLAALAAAWIGSAACGARVVVDLPGAQGGGGAASTTTATTSSTATTGSTATTTTTGGGVECSGTYAQVGEAVRLAQSCNPMLPQCTGKSLIHDVCGCLVIADDNPEAVNAADQAWVSCVNAGCCGPGATPITPPACPPCPSPPASGHCDPGTMLCAPGP